jgi:excisionase family DNA binding protein
MPTNDWITTQEAAGLSGYHPEHIRRLIRQGKIAAEQKGPMFWISKSSFTKYLRDAEKSAVLDKRHGPKRK